MISQFNVEAPLELQIETEYEIGYDIFLVFQNFWFYWFFRVSFAKKTKKIKKTKKRHLDLLFSWEDDFFYKNICAFLKNHLKIILF